MSFIIKLLTPTSSNSKRISFLETTISEFYSQEEVYSTNQNNFSNRKETYCYTFNEHFAMHTNGQKELSFSMLKNIWLDDKETVNPFLSSLHNGTQLLLIDKYNNEYFFTIKDIKFTFKDKNLIYEFSCQDSFTYQLIRQNDGYTIENNSDSEDFIGAKNIDWWVYNKISYDCYIGYTYVPLFQGLYLDKNHNLHTYLENSDLNNVEKIIKPIYDSKQYSEYYEAIPFSLSSSNASSALISLGENLGLNLNFKENNIRENNKRTTKFERFFWFEPAKNEELSGLKYSPYTSISSFGLNYTGDSLTTVLNVESTQLGDELITLIPEVPLFFRTLFNSNEWQHTTYTNGYFSSVCQGVTYILENGESADKITYHESLSTNSKIVQKTINGETQYYLEIQLWDLSDDANENNNKKLSIPNLYEFISFEKDGIVSSLYLEDLRLTPYTSIWEFVIDDKVYNNTFSPIPSNIQGTKQTVYLRITLPKGNNYSTVRSISNSKIILNFYRAVTSEELEFAEMADKCPWLENKIIDFNFFLNQNIISKSEYNKIWDILRNKLRIINGQLLLYTQSYYEAIHKKTELLSKLLEDLDSLGAAFQADVVNPYLEHGRIDNIDYFDEGYKTIISRYFSSTTPTSIVNYNELLTEYFNKYYKAQQRFLKNIYNFRTYFNTLIDWGNKSKLYEYNIEIVDSNPKNYVTFQNNQFISLHKKDQSGNFIFNKYNKNTLKPFVQIFDSDQKTILDIAHKDNYKELYYPNEEQGSFVQNTGLEGYNPNKQYYRRLYKTAKVDSIPEKFEYQGNLYTLHSSDEDYLYYGNAKPDALIESWENTIQYGNSTFTTEYVAISLNEIISEYLYNKGYNTDVTQAGIKNWFYHRTDNWVDTKGWIRPSDEDRFFSLFTPLVWLRCFYKEAFNTTLPLSLTNAFINSNQLDSNIIPELKTYYYNNFPVTNLKLINQPKYIENTFSFSKNNKTWTTSYQRVNAKNQTVQQYIDYWLKKQQGIQTEEILNPTKYTTSYDIPFITPKNENKYYRRVLCALNSGVMNGSSAVLKGIQKYSDVSSFISGITTSWDTFGLCFQDIYGKILKSGNNTIIKSGYIDSSQLVYTFSPEAYDSYVALKREREYNDFIGTISESDTSAGSNSPIEVNEETKTITRYKVDLAEYNKTKYLINDPEKLNIGKNYFDKYTFLGLTYQSLISENNNNIKYQDGWLRPLLLTDMIDIQGKYKLLIQEVNGKKPFILNNIDNIETMVKYFKNERFDPRARFSKTVYYPILNSCEDIDLSALNLTENVNLQTVLTKLGWQLPLNQDNSYWIKGSFNNIKVTFLFLQDEDFIRDPALSSNKFEKKNNHIYLNNRYNCYTGGKIYDELSGSSINFLKEKLLVQGLYYIPDKDTNFISCEDKEWKDIKNNHLYKKIGEDFVRIYTIEQLLKRNSASYYLGSNNYQFNEFETTFSKPLKVFLHKDTYEGNNIISSTTKEIPDFYEFKIDENNFKDGVMTQTVIDKITDGDDIYPITYKITRIKRDDLSKLTNGQFWYKYHTVLENPILFEKAAVIETQLTSFWQQAYTSSLYCEYFIPEYWQPRISGTTNHFSNKLFTIDDDNNIRLSDILLPRVSLISINGKTLLPSYNITYNNYNLPSEDLLNQKINTSNTISSNDLLQNETFKQIFSTLEESVNNFSVELIPNKEMNYYSGDGGLKWENIIPKFSTFKTNYSIFNGLYIMTYKILKNSFTNCSFKKYEELKQLQHDVWFNLYQDYSGILLESVYSNQDATSSQDLYVLASNFLKDKTEPEKGYSISIIDLDRLQGYYGQELSISTGIEIDAGEYHDSFDYLSKALSQYLFITDISYDLRKPSDIQITVNSIKYQDKLIQRLVKLIK